jgi:hypothetical protein
MWFILQWCDLSTNKGFKNELQYHLVMNVIKHFLPDLCRAKNGNSISSDVIEDNIEND